MSIAYGGIVAFFFRGLNVVLAFGTVLLTSRAMRQEDYGLFVLGLSVIGFIGAITGGMTAATAYQVSNQRRAPGVALANAGATSAGLSILALVGGLLGAQLLQGEAERVSLAVGCTAGAVIAATAVAGAFLGSGSLIRYNVALVLPPFLSVGAVGFTLLVLNVRSAEGALAAYAVGQWAALFLLGVSALMSYRRELRLERDLPLIILRYAALAGISSGISYLNYRADLFVVRHFEGKGGVAVYSLAVYLAESVWQVSGSLTLATYARIGALAQQEAAELTARVMRHTLVLLGGICGLLFLVAGLVESLLFQKYEGMASAVRYLLPGVLMYSMAQSFSGYYSYQRGKPWAAAIEAGGGLLLDITLAVILVPRMGVNGAALASSIAYAVAIVGGLAVFLRGTHLRPVDLFVFRREDADDYLRLFGRVRSLLVGRTSD